MHAQNANVASICISLIATTKLSCFYCTFTLCKKASSLRASTSHTAHMCFEVIKVVCALKGDSEIMELLKIACKCKDGGCGLLFVLAKSYLQCRLEMKLTERY